MPLNETEQQRQELIEHHFQDGIPDLADYLTSGSFHNHEALDRTHLAVNFVDENILNHPAIFLDQSRHELASSALQNLMDLYQLIGRAD
jgi:hypothetical protein